MPVASAPPAPPSEASPALSVSSPPLSSSSPLPSSVASARVAPPVSTVESLNDAVNNAIARGDVRGAVAAIARGDDALIVFAAGQRVVANEEGGAAEPMTEDTLFDVASLTKAVCTAPSVLLLAERGKLRLTDPAAKYLPGFGQKGKETITIEQLLLHTSGLLADNAIVDYKDGKEAAIARINALSLTHDPGETYLYSDVGYIVLGAVVEAVSGEPLDAFAHKNLFLPLGMSDTMFRPGAAQKGRIAPTEPRDGALLRGEVHDPRAARLGGVAGHAGLFSTARDLATFAKMVIGGGTLNGKTVLSRGTVTRWLTPHELSEGKKRAYGWDVQEGRSGVGHTGFTGTSMWIDPARKTAFIVLTSRLYPSGKGDVAQLRRDVAAVAARRSGPSIVPRKQGGTMVETGVDTLINGGFAQIAGKRIGLLTNRSGVDKRGLSTVNVLNKAPGVTLVKLFSPEHGIGASAEGAVTGGKDASTGLPLVSLYGQKTKPDKADMAGLDAIVVDLADAGARFYTYETTLFHLLEAAAESKVKVVVLDRPNPLGGEVMEGPVLEQGRSSFVGYHPLPVRHGMTLGELGRLFNAERSVGADLTVVPLKGWSRKLTFAETDLTWIPPSPNLRSPEAATLYPGIALFETTNVSVGRGTDRPFERLGAPWIDGAALAQALSKAGVPGAVFAEDTFTPTTSTHAGARCSGVFIKVTNGAAFSPLHAGMALARALMDLYGARFEHKKMITLLGHAPTIAALERGESAAKIVASWQADLAAFAARRRPYLLY